MTEPTLFPALRHEATLEHTAVEIVRFWVPGVPKTAGSKRAFVIRSKFDGKPRAIVTDDCKTSRDWKADVKSFAVNAWPGLPVEGPLHVEMTFEFIRPDSHFGTGKNSGITKPSAPAFPCGRPDVLKCARAVEDACTKILWRDDAQIVVEILRKIYSHRTGVEVRVVRL